ncbi:MAG: LysR family transcriptional regulator [Lachnospiraceae bacterium]|nr:LysR family transcriptional regulator [Lachnospiraceae bacterium]
MSLQHLRVFIAVYLELSITKAAQKLFISQPAVSRYIREIEETYGNKLFERSSRTLTVTPFGEDFYHYASQIISLYDEMNQSLSPANWHEHSFRIGVATVIGEQIMPLLVTEYTKLHPDFSISVTVGSYEQLANRLMDNSLDFAITEGIIDTPLVTNTIVHQEPLVAICNANTPLAKMEIVTAEDLAQYPLLLGKITRPSVEAYFEQHHLPIRAQWESASVPSLVNAVSANIGISFLSRGHVLSIANPNVAILNVPDLIVTHPVYVHHKKNRKLSPSMQDFIHYYLSYFTGLSRNLGKK